VFCKDAEFTTSAMYIVVGAGVPFIGYGFILNYLLRGVILNEHDVSVMCTFHFESFNGSLCIINFLHPNMNSTLK